MCNGGGVCSFRQVAYSEDCSKEIERDQVLHGAKACAKDDVIHRRWLSEYYYYYYYYYYTDTLTLTYVY